MSGGVRKGRPVWVMVAWRASPFITRIQGRLYIYNTYFHNTNYKN